MMNDAELRVGEYRIPASGGPLHRPVRILRLSSRWKQFILLAQGVNNREWGKDGG